MPRVQHRLFTRFPFLISSIILTFAFSAEAQSTAEKWSNLGPEQVDINCISVDPVDHDTIYVGTHAGLFKTTDGGQHWRNTYKNGLPNMDIYSVDIDPVDHKIIYLRTPYYVVKSTDGGDNWTNLHLKKVPSNTLELIPSQLIIDYVDHNTIFALASNVLMKTTDGGITWNVVQTGVQNDESINSVNLDRYQHGTLYVGVRKPLSGFNFFNPTAFQDRVIQSYDSGGTWRELANTTVVVNNKSVKFNAANLLPDPDNNGLDGFFVGDCDAFAQCQNLRCIKFGNAAPFCDSVPDGPSYQTIFNTPGNKASYFEAYVRATLGISCISCPGYFGVQFPFALVDYMTVDPTDTNTFYIKGRNPGEGLYKSTDGARTWTSIGKGLVNSTARAVAVDPSNPGVVFAGGATPFLYGGLWKRNDDQSMFKPISDPLVQGKDFNLIAIDPHNSNVILAADGGTIYRSIDGGLNWSISLDYKSQNPNSYPRVVAITFESGASDNVYAGFYWPNTATSPGILKSSDGGATWQPANAGLPSLQVAALVSETHSPGTLYASLAANGPGLFKTTDGGNSWQSVGLPCCGAYVLAVDPLHPGTIYSFGGSFLKSADYGATWTRLMAERPTDRYQISTGQGINSVAFDPLHPNTIYAATNTYPFRILAGNRDILFKGVFKSTNGGLSWWPSNDGLSSPFVTSLAADPSTGKLYAGTEGGGVFVTQPTQGPRTGDVNSDGKVDVRDLIALANGLAGNAQLDPFSADILADGKIDVQDLYALGQFLAGNVRTLPVAPSQ